MTLDASSVTAGGDVFSLFSRPSEAEAAHIRQLVAEHGAPLLILDGDIIRRQYRSLAAALPGVVLHYALKPLPHPDVVDILLGEGAHFDLATSGEVDLVSRRGVPADRCIHTHPIKRDADIRHALTNGVDTFVVDNLDELRKFMPYRTVTRLLLRVSFRSPDARVDLSRKFGCTPDQVPDLLRAARRMGLRMRGLCFHVGSQTLDPRQYVLAIDRCGDMIRTARREGHELRILDIGGGFPVPYDTAVPAIDAFCEPVREALERLPTWVQVFAEPGRFISAPAVTAVSSVMGRAERDGRWWYYLDDGLYGSFSGQLYDHTIYPLSVLGGTGPEESSVLAGPTCDSIDVIAEDILLPRLDVGDLIIGHSMGAYTWASATDFNFFPRAKVISINCQEAQLAVAAA